MKNGVKEATSTEPEKLEHIYGCSYTNPHVNCPACREEHKEAEARGEKWWHSIYCNCRDCH